MSSQKPSRIRRFFTRFIPNTFILILALFSLYMLIGQIVPTVAQRVGDFWEYTQRRPEYAKTATVIAPTVTTTLAAITETTAPTATFITPSKTNISVPTSTATHTASPAPTITPLPTDTETLEPATPTVMVVAQFFATNTPQGEGSLSLVTNTPAALPTETATSTATDTATPEPTQTFTAAPTETATSRPLPTLFVPANPQISEAGGTAVPTIVPVVDRRGYDLVNILLLGSDDELTTDNFRRTDTMIILSINRSTNTVAMLSLPRDVYVYIPSGTMNRLNIAYGIGENIGWTDSGFGLLRQTILYNFGINVHYYALVNFTGFEQIIDTIGGVDIAVDCAYEDYYPVEDFDPSRPIEENYALRTLDIGYYTMDGFDALWYARTRRVSDDFDRGRRQQQILRAIWRKTRDTGMLANLPTLWGQLTEIMQTNLGFEDMLGLLPIALQLDISRIENFYMIRTYHTTPWTTSSGENVQIPNFEPVRALLEDFYQPPTQNQVRLEGARISVFNGTGNNNWDRVAAERLAWEGFNAVSSGVADKTDYPNTILIDRVGREKGSSLNKIASILNVRPENINVEPDPNRTVDFEVILGSSYNSCTGFSVVQQR